MADNTQEPVESADEGERLHRQHQEAHAAMCAALGLPSGTPFDRLQARAAAPEAYRRYQEAWWAYDAWLRANAADADLEPEDQP